MASMIGMDRSRREQHRGLWAAARVREDGQSGVNLGARQIADGWARVYVFAGNPSNPSIDNSVPMTPCAAATRAVTLSAYRLFESPRALIDARGPAGRPRRIHGPRRSGVSPTEGSTS